MVLIPSLLKAPKEKRNTWLYFKHDLVHVDQSKEISVQFIAEKLSKEKSPIFCISLISPCRLVLANYHLFFHAQLTVLIVSQAIVQSAEQLYSVKISQLLLAHRVHPYVLWILPRITCLRWERHR